MNVTRRVRRGGRRAALEVVHALGLLLVRVLLPALLMPVQSVKWCVRWRELTDTVARPLPQVAAIAWTASMWWLLGSTPPTAALTAPAVVVCLFGIGRLVYPHTGRGVRAKRSPGNFSPTGWAEYPELHTKVSAAAVRKSTLYVRPSMVARTTPRGAARPSTWLLARIPVTDCGTYLGTTAIGSPWPVRCYASLESTIAVVGPPRKIKTSLMTHQVIDAPGAVISTQTRASTFHDTWWLRQRHSGSGRVYLCDPEGVAAEKFIDDHRPRPLRWAPQRVHRDPLIAAERAGMLVGASVKLGDDDGPWLASKAGTLLRAFLLIADVTDRTMLDVYDWCQSLDDANRALDLMYLNPSDIPQRWRTAVAGILGNRADRTLGAVFFALQEAVAFMGDPNAAALCTPDLNPNDPYDTGFNVAEFLADRGTAYLIATEREENRVGPLLAAFTGYVVYEALRLAGPRDGGRLDPPLHLNLDEAANTIPMPLNRWLPILGGSGVNATYSLQSRSQLRERLGEDGADTAWNATTSKVEAGGLTVTEDLRDISEQSGTRTETVRDQDKEVPVITLDQARRIPRWHAALIHDDMTLTLVKVRRPGLRPDVIAAKAASRFAPPPALPSTPTPRPALTAAPTTDKADA